MRVLNISSKRKNVEKLVKLRNAKDFASESSDMTPVESRYILSDTADKLYWVKILVTEEKMS